MLARRIWAISKIKSQRERDKQGEDRNKTKQREPKDGSSIFVARFFAQEQEDRGDDDERGEDRIETVRKRRAHSFQVPDKFAAPETCAQLRPKFTQALQGEKWMRQPVANRFH